VHQHIAHGANAAAEIARELLHAKGRGRFENSVVRPTIILVQQLNIIFSHGGDGPSLILCESYLQMCFASGSADKKAVFEELVDEI
jgi:hypothetical protein